MELNQLVQRIGRRHGVLIALCVLLGLGMALLVHVGDASQYTAATRLVLDNPDPKSQAESGAIADGARAIVTSPAQVGQALRAIGVERDPEEVARHHVGLDQLGSSAVLELSVRDRDGAVAAGLSNALADQLIQARRAARRGSAIEFAASLSARTDALDRQLKQVDQDINAAQLRVLQAPPNQVARYQAELTGLRSVRANLAQQKDLLETARYQLSTEDAMTPRPSIIDPATPPRHADPSRLPHDLALGALLGLTLGLGGAAMAETLRPSLVGPEALVQALRAPVLRHFDQPLGQPDPLPAHDLTLLLRRLKLAAARASLAASREAVTRVELLSVGPPIGLHELAGQLEWGLRLTDDAWSENGQGPHGPALPDVEPAPPAAADHGAQGLVATRLGALRQAPARSRLEAVRVFDEALSASDDETAASSGFVLVTPTSLARAELKPALDTMVLAGWPLVGIITHPRRAHRRPWRRASEPAAAPTGSAGR